MGGKQSKLRKELDALKAEAAASATKYKEESETLRNEKRLLEFKLQALQEMTARAQVEAEKATQLALESEEKMKALKWEMVRRMSTPVTPTSTVSGPSSSTNSLKDSTSSIPRVPVSWKLKDHVTLRRSNTLMPVKPYSKLEHDLSLPALGSATENKREPQRTALIAPTGQPAEDTRVKRGPPATQRGNQEETGAKPVSSVAPPSSATPPAQVDIFAPVKRRSSQLQQAPATVVAEAKTSSSITLVDGDNPTRLANSESSHTSSSLGDDDDDVAAASKRRGVHTSAKALGAKESRDDVLEFSDDDED